MDEVHARPGISRRSFVRMSAASAGALAAGGTALLAGCHGDAGLAPTDAALKKGGGGGKPRDTTRNPVIIPPTVAPVGLTLAAAPAVVDLGGGQWSNVLAYNTLLPGPTIRARRGDTATIRLENGLSDETITHWHGMIIDDVNDGHPRFAIEPDQVKDYEFPIVQRACLNWYHPHPHRLTGEQVNLGLAGAFIINDEEEDGLNLPSGDYEIPLIIRDAKINRAGDLEYNAKRSGFTGDVALVNGTRDATLDVKTDVYRLRILNGANARIFRLALDTQEPFTLIGNDGGLLEQAVTVSEILMSPAERIDVIVDFSGRSAGDRVMLRDLDAGWDLLEFVVTEEVQATGAVPTGTLSAIPALSNPVLTREFAFEGMSRINGQEYEMANYDLKVPLGQTERWIFTTAGNAPHPVHVHAAPFQVVSRSGGRGEVFEWERGWKDTVLLEDGETVEVLVHFDYSPGIYLIHCHKLEHEDAGMMMNFELV